MECKRKLIVFLVCLIAWQFAIAQLAIIEDVDGYVNVRESSSVNSNIVYRLNSNEVFYYDEENYLESNEWLAVSINKNKLSINLDPEWKLISGFVHRSRIRPLQTLKIVTKNKFSFTVKTRKFTRKNKFIEERNGYMEFINGLHIWGVDGSVPYNEIKEISYKINDSLYSIPEILFQDLYNVNDKIVVYTNNELYFVLNKNSDGAGSYEIVWVVDEKGMIRQRFVGKYY